MNMRFCDLCRLETRFDVLERVEDVFPLGLVCPACAVELREDEAHPRDTELEDESSDACDCCRGVGCRFCLAVPGWLG